MGSKKGEGHDRRQVMLETCTLSVDIPIALRNAFEVTRKIHHHKIQRVVTTLLLAYIQEPRLFRVDRTLEELFPEDALNRKKIWELLSSCFLLEVSSHEKWGHTITLAPVGSSSTARSAPRRPATSGSVITPGGGTSTAGTAGRSRSQRPSGPYSTSAEERRTVSPKVSKNRERSRKKTDQSTTD